MTRADFERLLTDVAARLTEDIRRSADYHSARGFENKVRELLIELGGKAFDVDLAPHPQIFPDIPLGEYGIEVKVVNADSWRSVANSVFEGTRESGVEHIYVMFGKMGGTPEA